MAVSSTHRLAAPLLATFLNADDGYARHADAPGFLLCMRIESFINVETASPMASGAKQNPGNIRRTAC
jgi:hypothetical protein